MMNWKGFGLKQLWAEEAIIGETEEIHRNLQFRQPVPGQDSSVVPPEYRSNLWTNLLGVFRY